MDYVAITKKTFVETLAAYHKAISESSQTYYYNQACALSSLLEKFGVDHMDIEELENEARKA